MNLQEIDMEKEYEQNLKGLGVSGADLVFMKNWLGFYRTQQITQDRQDIYTSLVAAVEGKKYIEPQSQRAINYNRGIDDTLTIINSIFKE